MSLREDGMKQLVFLNLEIGRVTTVNFQTETRRQLVGYMAVALRDACANPKEQKEEENDNLITKKQNQG